MVTKLVQRGYAVNKGQAQYAVRHDTDSDSDPDAEEESVARHGVARPEDRRTPFSATDARRTARLQFRRSQELFVVCPAFQRLSNSVREVRRREGLGQKAMGAFCRKLDRGSVAGIAADQDNLDRGFF